jgi:hypothetical protein
MAGFGAPISGRFCAPSDTIADRHGSRELGLPPEPIAASGGEQIIGMVAFSPNASGWHLNQPTLSPAENWRAF